MSQDKGQDKGKTLIGMAGPTPHPRPSSGSQPPATAPAHLAPTLAPADASTIATRPPAGAPGQADPLIGQELCGYTIRRKLAEGGMGVVYEGEHRLIGRLGAIKVLRLELCRSEQVVERFYQEARAVNSIRHENIVDIYDFGREPSGRVFFVMEYLEGEPLSARLRRGAFAWPEAFPILDQILRALKAAHDKGFVHRDLKPDNIWLRYVDGRVQVKLLDFGIAKLVGGEHPSEALTQVGSMIGTPHYMSPEQINSARDIDHRADVYALGVIIYEMFAGAPPFVGDTLQAIMTGHLFREPPRLAAIPNLAAPPPISDVVDRMLAKDAAHRYQSVVDALSDLHDLAHQRLPANAATLHPPQPGQPPSVPPMTALPSGPRMPSGPSMPSGAPGANPAARGRPGRVIAIAGGLVAAVIAIAVIASSSSDPPAPGAPASTSTPAAAAVAAQVPSAPAEPAPPVAPPLDDAAARNDAQATLRASLQQTEPAVRRQGADALGKIQDQPSVPALSELTERDPDVEVRGHAADTLGTLGASASAPLLTRLESSAPDPLSVWYASALARLGDKAARKRLLAHARSKDLRVSLKAALTLGELSLPGDRKAIDALRALAAREAELNAVEPYVGARILTRLAALRHAEARKALYAILEHSDEGARLAAAEGLAKLGDDTGRKVLQDVLANQASPNRLVAAVAQIPLGEYGGFDLIRGSVDAADAATRQLAARGLGELGERTALPALVALASDKDWTVRIAAAVAIVAIVGLSPQVLAQASVDWTRSALDSQDWAVRSAAAGVLADIPEKQALPLLAQAIADPDRKVRLAASRSAGKMKSADAATRVATAVKAETDPEVKEQQVKALAEIGDPGARDTLAQIAAEPGRLGVLAAGSLIALGDETATQKLDTAIQARELALRLAAMHAAQVARNPIVVPALKLGLKDLVFEVRFAAAEGLSLFKDKADVMPMLPVLEAGLRSRDAGVVGRALAALTRLGEKLKDTARTPATLATLIESIDPSARLAVLASVPALSPADGAPLLRRLTADSDQEVRRAAVDAIAPLAARDRDLAIRLYRPLVGAADPVVRFKASGQLARLVDPPVKTAVAPPTPPPAPAVPAVPDDAAAPADDKLAAVTRALDETTAAAAEVTAATATFDALAGELAAMTAAPARDDAAAERVAELAKQLEDAAQKVEAAAARVETAAKGAEAAGAGAADAPKQVEQARALAQSARGAASVARGKTRIAADHARKYIKAETSDAQMEITAADTAIAGGKLAEARQNLERAEKQLRRSGAKNARLHYSYGRLHEQMALRARDTAEKLKHWRLAAEAYQRFASSGTGPRVRLANERLAEIADEIKQLQP
jgi:eukaryotic-like serine/threonine-protein kinase